ncbi:MAG TPA: aminotransferase class III-fold pyridoxal phosphate-dependent enzyme [Xanthobacteraceae bacterium]|nr:aminotransferase class III-fold pyridoxal phosphate-dependent enzyme [Xanthobacteraceae bacterium]
MDAVPAKGLEQALDAARARYVAANPRSSAQLAAADGVMPGGNTRSVLFYEPFPLAIARGEGAYLWDADGHRYVDFLGEFTAGLYGHSSPVIRKAIISALDGGISLGGHNLLEDQLARLICERFPAMDKLRFTNSGTEANLMALALAKAATGRPRIMVFAGAYHGSVLSFAAAPSPINVPHEFIIAPYNDIEATRRLIEMHRAQLAAVLVEPMLGAGGAIPADAEFLASLREATRAAGALLIFDEVMTSRFSAGGRQKLLGIAPDLTTLGKYLGGGLSFGAFGGRADLLDLFDPRRAHALAHPGTFNNNVLSMAAGIAGLTELFTPDAADALTRRGEALRARLNATCAGATMQVTGFGSIMNVHFTAAPIRRPADAVSDPRLRDLFFFDMIENGIYLARRGLIALMLTIADNDEQALVAAVERFIDRRADLIKA